MLGVRRADIMRSAQRPVGFSAYGCPMRIVGPPAAASATTRSYHQKVQAAANFEAPVSREDDEKLREGVSLAESSTATGQQGWELGWILKELGLAKRFPRDILVVRVEDPWVPDEFALPAQDGKLREGLYISSDGLLNCGSPDAIEDYLLNVFDIVSRDGEAYVLSKYEASHWCWFRVRRAPELFTMVTSADMFLVHGPSIKQQRGGGLEGTVSD